MDTTKGVTIGSAVSAANVEPNHCSNAQNSDDEWLIVSKRDSKSRLLPRRMIFVGRKDCDICVPSTTVDMRHAVLSFTGHQFHIKDLNSAYGTYLNDKRISGQCYVRLQHSDRLRFGFGPDLFTIEKISSLPLTTSVGYDLQLNSGDIESVEKTPQIESQNSEGKADKRKEGLTTTIARLNCENHSNSSLSNSVDSLEDIKSIKNLKDSKIGYVLDKKEEMTEINEEMSTEVITSSPHSTPAPDSLGSVDSYGSATAFIITFDDDNENNKKMKIKDSIRQFAPPKPDSIEKQRPSKSARNESIKCNENLFNNQKSPTNRSKRQTNALSANKTTKILNKTVKTPTSSVSNTSPESGHLSDSAAFLINKMLSDRKTQNIKQTTNMRTNNVSSAPPKAVFSEKAESGLSDDIKSESGDTYIVDENEEVEEARKKIDYVFGLDDSTTVSLNSSPDSSLTLNSPTLLMNFEENLSKIRKSFDSTKFERKVDSSDTEVKQSSQQLPNNSTGLSTYTRTKRRVPTVEEMLHKTETKTNDVKDKSKNSSNIYSNDLNGKHCNSSHQFPSINETQNKTNNNINNNVNIANNQIKAGVSNSAPSTPRSPIVSRKLAELRTNKKSFNVNRRKNSWNSDLDYYESYNSDESTDQSHRSSNSALSKEGGNASSASVPSKINFNRAFALRRARLGIDTPGIDLTTSKSPLNRNDGGRFSLRVPKKDPNDRKIGNRISSKEKINNNSVQRKNSDPLGSIKSAPNRGQSVMSCASDTDHRNVVNGNRFNQFNNRLRHNYNQNNNTNVSKNNMNCRQKTFTDSELSVSQRSKQIGSHSGQQMTSNLNNLSHRRNGSDCREGSMSSSLTEPSHKPPMSSFHTKNVNKSALELTALDGLVVSAINQLTLKMRNNLSELIESQRLKHPTNTEARNMIDEVLPQLSSPERRLNDHNVSVSRDLSSALKNLKKIEQSYEVISHLLEPNATKARNGRKQSNDFFVVDV